jgi:acid phosphatase (class A)
VALLPPGRRHRGRSDRDAWWSPALRAQLILAEFARTDWMAVRPDPPDESEAAFRDEIRDLLDLRDLRAGRMAEIVTQSASFVDCWTGLLFADGGRRPHTATLIHAGIVIGTLVGMHWKAQFKRARPAQVMPLLLPPIPTPPHPSYPSGHSLQSHLIKHLVLEAMPTAALREAMGPMLSAMARRLAENREVAGLHYRSDSEASRKLAEGLLPILRKMPGLTAVMNEAKAEWADLQPGPIPEELQPWLPLTQDVAEAVVQRLSSLSDGRP